MMGLEREERLWKCGINIEKKERKPWFKGTSRGSLVSEKTTKLDNRRVFCVPSRQQDVRHLVRM